MQFACIRNCGRCPLRCGRVKNNVQNQPSLVEVIENNARVIAFSEEKEALGSSSVPGVEVLEENTEAEERGLEVVSDAEIVENLPALQEVQYEILADKKKSIFPWRKK